jgi:hypothetical protein
MSLKSSPMFSRIALAQSACSVAVSSVWARRSSAAISLLSLALGAGCSAEADLPEVVVTRNDLEFLGVPAIPGITDGTQTISTTFDHPSDVELPSDLNPELHPLAASIQGNGDMQDLSFLETMTMTINSRKPGGPPPEVVASYERTKTSGVGRTVKLRTDPDSDILTYWDTKQAYYEVTLSGILPSEDWSIDVSFSFEGSFSISTSN